MKLGRLSVRLGLRNGARRKRRGGSQANAPGAGAIPQLRLIDDDALHRYLLAYASDFSFIGTALLPHGVSWMTGGMQVASLDHAMWFHQPFRVDDWLLHVMESPTAQAARGLVRGQIFTRDGRLIASTAQEGLIRQRV